MPLIYYAAVDAAAKTLMSLHMFAIGGHRGNERHASNIPRIESADAGILLSMTAGGMRCRWSRSSPRQRNLLIGEYGLVAQNWPAKIYIRAPRIIDLSNQLAASFAPSSCDDRRAISNVLFLPTWHASILLMAHMHIFAGSPPKCNCPYCD